MRQCMLMHKVNACETLTSFFQNFRKHNLDNVKLSKNLYALMHMRQIVHWVWLHQIHFLTCLSSSWSNTHYNSTPDSYQQLDQMVAEVLWVQVRSVAEVGPRSEEVPGLSQPLVERGKVVLKSGGEKKRLMKAQERGVLANVGGTGLIFNTQHCDLQLSWKIN